MQYGATPDCASDRPPPPAACPSRPALQRRQGLLLQHVAVPAVRPQGEHDRPVLAPPANMQASTRPVTPASCLLRQVVALANLLPAEHEADDLDSYMYQTVGHQVVAAYAQCMHLPLYRRAITGRSADQVRGLGWAGV